MHGALHDIHETYFVGAVIYTDSDDLPDRTQRRDALTRPIKLGRGVFGRRSDNYESNALGWLDETSPQIRWFQYGSLSMKQRSLLGSMIKFHFGSKARCFTFNSLLRFKLLPRLLTSRNWRRPGCSTGLRQTRR